MPLPSISKLMDDFEHLLSSYEPTSMLYLDHHGQWRPDPATLRDRISNELVFLCWEIKNKQTTDNKYSNFSNIFQPFLINEPSWNVTCQLVNEKIDSAEELLIILESVYQIIECEVYQRLSESYVPDWDYQGKTKKERSRLKAQELFALWHQILKEDKNKIALQQIIGNLKCCDVFNEICLIIQEEESIRQNMNDLDEHLKDTRYVDEQYSCIDEQVSFLLEQSTGPLKAFLRPCMKLFEKKTIDISSGIHYEAAILLGILKDQRSTDFLLNLIPKIDFKYASLRMALIYALGNVKQKKAINMLISLLSQPAFAEIEVKVGTTPYRLSLNEEKRETIWALGKLGAEAIEAISELSQFSNHKDAEIRLSLAWAMGMIGSGQHERFGGLSADVVIALLNLLVDKNVKVFEEAALSLRNLRLPDFLHTLYLHNIATVPILSLKPSSIGLFELSETLFYLRSLKKPVVMAVTGDSGTGKTYFCQSIVNGFGDLRKSEILYMARDNPAHNKLFDRMLGLKLLKEFVSPQFYADYPLSETDDDPGTFFDHFMIAHADKKLIILDGWRDEGYFHHVIRTFYEKGYLDVIVKFQTTYSTRRLNLEEREGSLDKVKICLSYHEEPVIEQTRFYREGKVFIYNLDNSESSRLSQAETLEIFKHGKVETWGDYIRIGRFDHDLEPLNSREEISPANWEDTSIQIETIKQENAAQFTVDEAAFKRMLNDDLETEPNLLQIIRLDQFQVNHLAFYMPGQLIFCADQGSIGILSGINDRAFYTRAHKKDITGMAIVGDDIVSINVDGKLKVTSFHKNTITELCCDISPACSIASDRVSRIITGHNDGTIRIWDFRSGNATIMKAYNMPIRAVTINQSGAFAAAFDKQLCIGEPENNRIKILEGKNGLIKIITWYPNGEIVLGLENERDESNAIIKIIDFHKDIQKIIPVNGIKSINALNVYFDGRIIAAAKGPESGRRKGTMLILDPRPDFLNKKILSGHAVETKDCVTMGPRIITCGSEQDSLNTLRIWGTKLYVKIEHDKLKLINGMPTKPPYYSSLF